MAAFPEYSFSVRSKDRAPLPTHTHSPRIVGRSLLLYMMGFLLYNFSVGSRLSAHTHSPRIVGRSLLLYMAGFPPCNFSVGNKDMVLCPHILPKNCR